MENFHFHSEVYPPSYAAKLVREMQLALSGRMLEPYLENVIKAASRVEGGDSLFDSEIYQTLRLKLELKYKPTQEELIEFAKETEKLTKHLARLI